MAGDVTIVAVKGDGDAIVNVTYGPPDGGIDERPVDADLLDRFEILRVGAGRSMLTGHISSGYPRPGESSWHTSSIASRPPTFKVDRKGSKIDQATCDEIVHYPQVLRSSGFGGGMEREAILGIRLETRGSLAVEKRSAVLEGFGAFLSRFLGFSKES